MHFERRGEELITEWEALRDQHPILTDRNDAIIGNYFEKVKEIISFYIIKCRKEGAALPLSFIL